MGKQQQVTDDLEERRRVTRELNEASRDARVMLRELRTETAHLKEEVAELSNQMNGDAAAIFEPALLSALAKVRVLLDAATEKIHERVRDLVGMESADALLEKIGSECVQILLPHLRAVAEESAEKTADKWLQRHIKVHKVRGGGGLIVELDHPKGRQTGD